MLIKLRMKFVGITFLSIMLITAIILGLSMMENFIIIDNQINQILRIIENNNGLVADVNDIILEDEVYATRYFVVTFNDDSSINNIDLSKTTISETDANQLALRAISARKNTGYIDDFKFQEQSNTTLKTYTFLDCGMQLSSIKSSFEATVAIYMISMMVVFGILMMLSGRVLKPITENIRKQKQFVTNAGHELKTPLAIMTANLDVLEIEVGEENEWIQSTRNQVTRLNSLIKSLLSLSQYEDSSIKNENEFEIFNLNELIKEELENFKAMSLGKNIVFCDNDVVLLKTEIETIRQLIGLFLDNAIKYTPEGKDININLIKQKNKIKLIFENEFDSSKKLNTKRIFERFYRGEKSHDKSVQGYVIVLSIFLSIV